MINAKNEIIDHIGNREITKLEVAILSDDDTHTVFQSLEDLDFIYDNGYGVQCLYGVIEYTDGTWSERIEYDGKEYWKHIVKPTFPIFPQ
jgi:hypothetical protein